MTTTKGGEGQLEPEWVVAAKDAGLGPLQQVKEFVCWCETPFRLCPHAGHTCEKCPNPYRPANQCVCVPPEPPDDYPEGVDDPSLNVMGCRPRLTWGDEGESAAIGCGLPPTYTKRCRTCDTRMRRWSDGRSMAKRAVTCRDTIPEAVRIAWVTMTLPNYPASMSEADATRAVKKELQQWRRSVGVEEHVLGGIDYYECTTNAEDGSRNAHQHGLWIMGGYWKQSDMLNSWGRGGARIEDLNGRENKAADYCTSYGSKAPVKGVRCKETWGVCRGEKWQAVQNAVVRAATLG